MTMPLTDAEREFLTTYYPEYMAIHQGPAMRAIRERGIACDDIKWLLNAIAMERDEPPGDPGTDEANVTCPWADAEEARRRNDEIEPFVYAAREAHRKAVTA
jgi:hypothetical protein